MLSKQKLHPSIKNIFSANDVQFAALFGSRAKGLSNSHSDYDFLVKFKPKCRYTIFDLLDLRNQLQHHLKKSVDVVTSAGLNPKMKKEISRTMQIVYGSR